MLGFSHSALYKINNSTLISIWFTELISDYWVNPIFNINLLLQSSGNFCSCQNINKYQIIFNSLSISIVFNHNTMINSAFFFYLHKGLDNKFITFNFYQLCLTFHHFNKHTFQRIFHCTIFQFVTIYIKSCIYTYMFQWARQYHQY